MYHPTMVRTYHWLSEVQRFVPLSIYASSVVEFFGYGIIFKCFNSKERYLLIKKRIFTYLSLTFLRVLVRIL